MFQLSLSTLNLYYIIASILCRLAYVISKIDSAELSQKIACMLPMMFKNSLVFNRLITSNPAVPYNELDSAMLCKFMSRMIFFIEEEHSFQAACGYFKSLVVGLKQRQDVLELALPDVRNIEYLLVKICYVKEESAIEILRLLKVILLVQVYVFIIIP